jgi:oligopeptide transport system substrate-binding protein
VWRLEAREGKLGIRIKWHGILVAVVAAGFVFTAACGDDDKSTDPTASTSATAATPASGAEYQYVLTEAPSDAAPPDRQKLNVNLRGEPDSLDPQKSNFADNVTVERLLFAGLVTFDDDLAIVPLVAAEVPSVENGGISSDGLTYTFKLRGDTKWSDGQIVTAKDFQFAIRRLFDPTVGVYYASFYTDIVGATDTFAATDASLEEIARLSAAIAVTAIDDTTLEIKLEKPVSSFLARMALHAVYPVREDVVSAHPDDWTESDTIITNGPFTLEQWEHEDHITLKANPGFFLGEPVLQEIRMVMQSDTNVALAQYVEGALSTSQVPPAARNDIRNTRKAELREGNTLSTFALEFNSSKPPFDDVNVRKAFAAAMDRDAYVTAVLQGVGVPSVTWIPPGVPGHDPDAGIPFDASAAKNFLATSEKYPGGDGMPSIKFTAADDTANQLIAAFVKTQAQDILGVNVEIDIRPSAAFQAAHNTGDFQMAFGGWGADYPDPDNWLPAQFGTGASLNVYGYSNAEVDRLLAEAASELDTEQRIGLYQQAQQIIIARDAAVAPLDHDAIFHLVKPSVKGWRLSPLDAQIPGDFGYARVYISK